VNLQRIEQNGFRLLEQVDSTSRTVLWKAVQQTLDRTVIIQILKPEVSADASEVDHFLSTARLFARIKSDSIVAVFDIVSKDDLNYVVCEHVDGPTLEELVNTQGPLPVERALRIAAALIASLDQMWTRANIVHRNLKSSTIRLDPRGVAKITDFNLAIKAGPGVDATAMDKGLIVGTPCFLSPEQAQGTRTLTMQSDMYALGAVLYHLTTGHAPFEDLAPIDILSAHVRQQIPPPHRINRRIPLAFSWFLHRLMMKNPNNRYADWDEVLLDIRHLLAGTTPMCVRPTEEFLSTIANPFDAIENSAPNGAQAASRIRLSRKAKNSETAPPTGPDKALNEHARGIRLNNQKRENLCWGLLLGWLVVVFWFRTVYQTDPAFTNPQPLASPVPEATRQTSGSINGSSLPPKTSTVEESLPTAQNGEATRPSNDAAPAAQPAAEPSVPVQHAAPQTDSSTGLPTGIPPPVLSGLALALSSGDLAAAQKAVRNASEKFQEKESLLGFLEQIPSPDTLVADYLKSQIGKPLLFEHNGKQRTVIPRSVENNIVHLESNGRGAELPIDKLTADEKLRWMDKPQAAARWASYCIVLLHSSKREEIHARVSGCPLLSSAFIQAAELVPATTPPAESPQSP
jgi:serine/threonine protein kinase